ncbi:MAG: twin-arginine translocase TatA/TatE family subunit [Candidatus Sumerlaeia bacterium]
MIDVWSSISGSAFLFGPGGVGWPEMLIIFGLILIFFGPKRLPQLSKSIGKSIRNFQKGLNDIKEDIERAGESKDDDDSDEDEDEDYESGDMPVAEKKDKPKPEPVAPVGEKKSNS